MAVIFIILVNYFGNEVPLVVRTFQKIILKNFDKFWDNLSSENIFVTQGYKLLFFPHEWITGYSYQPEKWQHWLSHKKNFRVTNQKIVKDYFSSIHYLTPNLVINLYLKNSITQLWLVTQLFCHPLWSVIIESFTFEDVYEDDISILSFLASSLNIDTLESNIVPFWPQKLVDLFPFLNIKFW